MMGRRRAEFAPFAPSPHQQPRLRLRLLVVGGVVVAVLGGFVLGRAWDSSDPAPAQESTEAASTPASPAPDDDGTLSPDDVTWRDHAGLSMPFSAEHGPFEDEGGWTRGFSRTSQGAVMAGTHIFLQASNESDMPESAIRSSFDEQLTGEHADAFVERMVDAGFTPAEANIKVEGYLLHDYDDNGAVFELAAASATEGVDGYPIYTATMLTVMWENGDWRLLVPESTMEHVRLLDNTDEFTPFPRDE